MTGLSLCFSDLNLVGTGGFEPPTPCTPCKCATRLRYAPRCLATTGYQSGVHNSGFDGGMEPARCCGMNLIGGLPRDSVLSARLPVGEW